MKELSLFFESKALLPAPSPHSAKTLAGLLEKSLDLEVYPQSLAAQGGVIYFCCRRGREKFLGLAWRADKRPAPAKDFSGESLKAQLADEALRLKIAPADAANAAALRRRLKFTAPQLMGKRAALGCGDRLGIATPGHIRALRGSGLAGFFAQQSARELARTHRTARQVMDAATWGVFQEGYREGFGADADHLKTTEDIDAYLAAGFTFFTIDPGDQVEPAADSLPPAVISRKFKALPWEQLETSAEAQRRSYLGRKFSPAKDLTIAFNEETLLRAAVKYGGAVAHTTGLFRYLQSKGKPFELEISVDETATPTSLAEHYYVARELKRLGVKWVSLAPRFVGKFEKGVDYIGDLVEFADTCRGHVEIARALGDYKLSLHSGSDKFSIYPVFSRLAGDRVQVKTAGTSYLEALRVITELDPPLFREILEFACEHYPKDRASYHVSAELYEVPKTEELPDSALPAFLEHFDTREVLHVTFGSVLTAKAGKAYRFRDRLLAVLQENEESYYAALEVHFRRHVKPFARRG
jgi:tagaturonate epimerase